MKKTIHIVAALAIVVLPFIALASDIQQQQSTLYPYQSTIAIQDDFMSGSVASASVGALGWGSSGGSTSYIASETNRIGLLRKDTSTTTGTLAYLILQGNLWPLTDPALPHDITFVTRLNTNDANTTVRYGAANAYNANPPTNGIYLEKLDADTNWFCVTRAGGVQTRTDSSVAVSTSFEAMRYVRNSSGVQFSINGVPVCGTVTTNIPTTFINPGLQIVNSAAASKTLDIDYAQIVITGLSR